MKPFIPVLIAADCLAPDAPTTRVGHRELPMMILGHAAVRMDGDCLLLAGGEPLHGPFHPDACEAMRFCASHIEPIEDET